MISWLLYISHFLDMSFDNLICFCRVLKTPYVQTYTFIEKPSTSVVYRFQVPLAAKPYKVPGGLQRASGQLE